MDAMWTSAYPEEGRVVGADQLPDRRSAAQRVWLALSTVNVWACGVASAQHDPMLFVCVFFAVVCWGMSSVRFMAWFDGEEASDAHE